MTEGQQTFSFRPAEPEITVVVPTYREVENLRELVCGVVQAVTASQQTCEIVIVDDNSSDGTIELCDQLAEEYPVRLVTRIHERGLSTAVIRGFSEARGQYVVVMDADLSHPPAAVPDLVRCLQSEDVDFVVGSRYVPGGSVDQAWTLWRHMNSRVATLMAAGLTSVQDPMAGFFAFRRSLLGDLTELNPCGYKIGLELMVRRNCRRVVEIPIRFADRRHGESKLSFREQRLYVQHLLRLYAFRYSGTARFALFAAVGVSGMVVDLLTFRSLISVLGIGFARTVAIALAMTWNYELNRRVTFSDRTGDASVRGYLNFCLACLTGAVINWGTTLVLIESSSYFRFVPVAAAACGTVAAAAVNFVMCSRWVFGRPAPATAAQETIWPETLPIGTTPAAIQDAGSKRQAA
ncbi:MAG: glycosyltransferase family 2 protein [Planctomycetaceae bacterium]